VEPQQVVLRETALLAPPPTLNKQITAEVGVSPATISSILRRLGLNRLQA
jgi:hypothetical protein